MKSETTITDRQKANGCDRRLAPMLLGMPCCYADDPVCLCHQEAVWGIEETACRRDANVATLRAHIMWRRLNRQEAGNV